MMPANSIHLIVKSLFVGLVWQAHCVPALPRGKIICVSDLSGRTGAEMGDALGTAGEVKAKAMETYSESDVKHFMEGIPKLYKFKSTVFTDLDQRNAIVDDSILMENQLNRIRDLYDSYTYPEYLGETHLNKLSKTIQELVGFQELIQKGTKVGRKMEGPASHKEEIENIGREEHGPVKKKQKIASPSFETAIPRDVGLDLLEKKIHSSWDGRVDKLSAILHEIPLLRSNDNEIINSTNRLSLEVQNLLFQQVGYLYKQNMISEEAFKKFCQSEKTLEIAALNMIYIAAYPETLRNTLPVTVLNEWTSENFRKMYEVLDEKNKRYFSYIALKEFDYEFPRIGSFPFRYLFREDRLFNTLEKTLSHLSRNSDSRVTLQELRDQDTNYVQIKAFVQELISMFQDNEDSEVKNKRREISFVFLDFIHNHYGLEMFGLDKGEKFEEKMTLMSSSLKLLRELENIFWYIKKLRFPGRNIPERVKNENGEEILMFYKLTKYLVSKNKRLLIDPEVSNYCRTSRLHYLGELIDRFVTEVIDQHKYYFIH